MEESNQEKFKLCTLTMAWISYSVAERTSRSTVFTPTKLDTTRITNVISGMNVIKRKMTKNVSSSIAQNASFSDHHNSKRMKRCQVTNHISKGRLHCPSTVSNKNIHFWIDKRDKGLIGLGKKSLWVIDIPWARVIACSRRFF